MRRVLIVDDEKWVRRGLIQSIGWSEYGLELAGEAENGDDAYTLALAERPDVLFLDMRMPGMDGKQLLALLSAELPELLVIVISGYSDFEYTKEAIRHKVFDYLLKPVRKEELNAVLHKACGELEQREEQQRMAAQGSGRGWFEALLDGPAAEEEAGAAGRMPPDWAGRELIACAGQSDTFTEPADWDAAGLLAGLREQLNRVRPFLFGNGGWDYEAAVLGGSARTVVLAVSARRMERDDVLRVCGILQQVLKGSGCPAASAGISQVKEQGGKLCEAVQEAVQALKGRLLGQQAVILEAGGSPAAPGFTYPSGQERMFLLALQSGSSTAAQQEYTEFHSRISLETVSAGQLQRSSLLLLYAVEKQLQAKGADFTVICGKSPAAYTEILGARNDAASVARIFTAELIPAVSGFYNRLSEKQAGKVVEEMKQQVEAYYNQALSLQGIAQSYYMNPDYLSRMFKKATGKNFIDYLTDVRIGKAKELLKLSNYKNYEIAQMVGYEDYRYFSQIFKKKLGMTIGEYRNAFTCQADLQGREEPCRNH
ncbi:response regulator [Paenibacillus sp. MMS20-IR301]|uniref:response regulator transcription factor n=1 Tax=Paenibacillus sp. MMS20-IR301 TaxID=2895946 RepID=UPI0028E447EA|nr:response regulator [Paenibacillus sp. MMS20-IR301]WNS46664.1 response regulator [Paenibacillus sp. MMS20-IR301]